ncbi:MAG: HAMP domain-containing histidine kinase [Chloroflexi bacterium]|nr:HAMP domain-containing histidine kinase [Chloroflexota bacterium]
MDGYEILPLDENTRNVLVELARRLRPYQDQLARRWEEAFAASAPQQRGLSDKSIQLIINTLVSVFFEYVGEGRIDDYLHEVTGLSEQYIESGLSYETMISAMHLYEEASLPLLMREYTDPPALMEVLFAQDHLYHNILILVASTYFGRLNDEIRSRAEQLQESYTRHEQFVSMVAHELRSPLSVILGYIQLAIQAVNRGKGVEIETLQRVLTHAQRLKRLMEDLQDASSIDVGRFGVRKGVCDVVAIATESARQLAAADPKHPIAIQAPDSLLTLCDIDRITQVVDNLVGNAAKYSAEGSEIRVTVRQLEDKAVVSVEDQGYGISAEDMQVLFQPFSRLYRQTEVKGTGLGLFITKAIVEAHGGSIWAESEPGKGSTFSFSLPIGS